MWLNILMSVLSSEATKVLIGLAVKKLLEHSQDGITKDVAEVMIDGIIQSKANDINEVEIL